MANRLKPTRLKVLEGNPGKRPLNTNEPEPERGIPPMPEWLRPFPVAVEEWERESLILDNMGLMTVADGPNLAHRCYLEAILRETAIEIQRDGLSYEVIGMDSVGNETRRRYANPMLSKWKELAAEHRQIGNLLGLDAPSRSKMSVDPDWKKKRKFSGLIGGENKSQAS